MGAAEGYRSGKGLPVLKETNHATAQLLIVFRSMFSEWAATLEDSTIRRFSAIVFYLPLHKF